MTREQRRLNLEATLRELETRRTLVERRIASAGTSAEPEQTHELTMLQAQIADAQRQLDDLTGGDQQTQAYRRAVDHLGQWAGSLQTRIQNVEISVTDLSRRLAQWIEDEADVRHERQEALDEALDDIRRLVERGADERRAQLREMRLMVMAVMAVQVALVALFFWGALAMRPILELWR